MTDPIADMITRIRNAQAVSKAELRVPYSKFKDKLAEILVKEGYLKSKEVLEDAGSKELTMVLKYMGKKPAIKILRKISTPGHRVYVGAKNMPYVYNNLGVAIISTSKGLMTNKEARSTKIGGEVICEIF
ncbi:MAG: 30S ribosomal protein S8 [Candidatus Kerfeldbacteria bacterium RIFOXYA2_FULL_38_24]|uniref:Small ribosomal subunit protein uS8 n=1 Tax=Candidatus Kerfeldbacteria bacterium RIFOXYB2_FULL_38_14 TaxID=1798547 RepID=A0A1G2BEU1_9BACT|nr:MAG: 30S ribosomal protein S8 [Candidatus Kerfeldbacteria bacterium RIFOXYB2_FULL_38_14]OGY87938.1 MAG: 30S ribosomal protein S8 [Candidatus Kerfeldbacteria bacterium RIFOXYA2_FULL_38_24]OGY88650.1 MAG: 30S ribosomal protein S8 [Candidatus Kerfeldbacteria bacterium RIFOXYC2_FULL_38_9]